MNRKIDDREMICTIISEMLNNPNECGIYPTTKCYDALEDYIAGIRAETKELKIELIRELKDAVYLAQCMLDGSKDEAAAGVCLSGWEQRIEELEGGE